MASRSKAKSKKTKKAVDRPARGSKASPKAPKAKALARAAKTPARPAAVKRPAPAPAPARGAVPSASRRVRQEFLERMHQTLLEKRKALVGGVRESSMDSIEASSETVQDTADQAATAYTKEFLLSIGDAERRLLQQVDEALAKIRRKTYGICDKCGEPVGDKRLLALPFARMCIKCAEEEEEQRR
jgi:DnaK suppressor protein